MKHSTVRRSFVAVLTLAAALSLAALAEARSARFEVEVIPPLPSEIFDPPWASVTDLNNAGQVTGFSNWRAFRYTPDVGTEALLPGDGMGRGQRLNDRGDVLGLDSPRDRWFLYTDDNGIDTLRQGFNGQRGSKLFISDLNNHGELVGTAIRKNGIAPMLYQPDGGWRDLSTLDSRFGRTTFGKWINDSGNLVFTISGGTVEGAPKPYARQQSFVLRADGLVELKDSGPGVNVPGDLNESGQLAGIYIDATGREQAYVFRPGEGVVKVDVGNFRESAALWINSEGVVGGTGNSRKGRDSIFFAATGPKGPSRVIRRGKFKRLVREAGSRKLVGMQVLTMNERLEFIGEVRAENPKQRIPFFYSRSAGVVSIQSLLDAAGADLELEFVIDLNDRGQILVEVRQPDGMETGAILTPAEKSARLPRRSKARNELGRVVKPLPEPAGEETSGPRRGPRPNRERPRL